MGESVYENSVIEEDGFSEVGESDYNVSERGSVYIGMAIEAVWIAGCPFD